MYDVALTFEELKVWMNDQIPEKSAVPVDPTNKFVPNTAYEGSLYPIDGGMNETIRRIGIKKKFSLLILQGSILLKMP